MTQPPTSEPRLNALTWLPNEHPKAVLVVAHGLAEHAARYQELAETMVAAGVAVYAADHRGHGRTAKRAKDLGLFAEEDGWDLALDDLESVIAHASAMHKGLPVFLLGHSMGSALARCYASEHSEKLAGLILTGTLRDPGLPGKAMLEFARLVRELRGARYRSSLLQSLAYGPYSKPFRPNRTDFDWLSRDTAEVDAYIADTLCGFVPPAQMYVDLISGMQLASNPERVARMRPELPVLLAVGGDDPAAAKAESVEALFRGAEVTDVTSKVYPEARHDLYHETNREEFFEDLTSWLQEHLSKTHQSQNAAS